MTGYDQVTFYVTISKRKRFFKAIVPKAFPKQHMGLNTLSAYQCKEMEVIYPKKYRGFNLYKLMFRLSKKHGNCAIFETVIGHWR